MSYARGRVQNQWRPPQQEQGLQYYQLRWSASQDRADEDETGRYTSKVQVVTPPEQDTMADVQDGFNEIAEKDILFNRFKSQSEDPGIPSGPGSVQVHIPLLLSPEVVPLNDSATSIDIDKIHSLRGVNHLNLRGVVDNLHSPSTNHCTMIPIRNTSNPTMTPIHRSIVELVEAGSNLPTLVVATQIQAQTLFLLLPQARPRPMQDHRHIPHQPQAWAYLPPPELAWWSGDISRPLSTGISTPSRIDASQLFSRGLASLILSYLS
ncbi:hypothetical protein F4604DRAFT_1935910 [Suillus subluteus]|nr:hypothetical protein F4604DRAFT_1935910 [Suillus subluteus]